MLSSVGPGGRPLDPENQVVVAIPVELVDGPLGVAAADEVDEAKAPANTRLLVHRDVHAANGAEGAEELEEVRLPRVLRQVCDPHRVLVVPAPVREAPLAGAGGARPHPRRHISTRPGARGRSCCRFGARGPVNERVGGRGGEVLVRTLRRPVVALLVADPADHENCTGFRHRGQGIRRGCLLRLAT